jgi:hypothetical protein
MTLPNMTGKLSFCSNSRLWAAGLYMAVTVFVRLGDRRVSHADSVPAWLIKASQVDLGHFGEGTAAIIVGDWKDWISP